MSPGFFLTIRRYDNQLKVQATGQREGPIFPKSQKSFYLTASPIEFTFNTNDDGEVESITVHPDGGDDIICKRADD
jgi:serine-type D-Ala-D-Ala carboxypeptidase/endopeptidase